MKIALSNITVDYGAKAILENLSLEIPEGKLLSVLGTSGAGKTTLLRLISGLNLPLHGKVFFDDKDVTHLPAEKRNVGYVFQRPMLFPHMNLAENIRFGMEIQKWPADMIRKRLAYLFQILQLEGLEDRMPSEISGGQQQRAAIARALATEPPVLLMDEPFSSLDPQLRLEMGSLIRSIQKQLGITIIFVTHDRAESMALSHQIALLLDGRIAQVASPADLFYRPASRQIARYMGECNFIHGQIRNEQFCCRLGCFPASGQADGDAQWLIRPHQIVLHARDTSSESKDEQLVFLVEDCRISGKEAWYRLAGYDTLLQVETFSDDYYMAGSEVRVSLPCDRMYLMRDEKSKKELL